MRPREAVEKLPEPAVAINSPFGKGAAPKARGLSRETGRPSEDDMALLEMRCAEVRLPPICKTTPGQLRDRVKSSQDFTYATAPFN